MALDYILNKESEFQMEGINYIMQHLSKLMMDGK